MESTSAMFAWTAAAAVVAAGVSLLLADVRDGVTLAVAVGLLLGAWAGLGAQRAHPVLVDLVDGAGFFALWMVGGPPVLLFGAMLASLWFRCVASAKPRPLARFLLYVAVSVAVGLLAPPNGSGLQLKTLVAVVAMWAVAAAAAGRLRARLADHDQADTARRAEAALGAVLVGEVDQEVITRRAAAHWSTLCEALPAIRIAVVEPRTGEVLATHGRWSVPPARLAERELAATAPLVALTVASSGVSPTLDGHAGARCRWAHTELRSLDGAPILVVGIGSEAGHDVATAVTSVIAQTELALAHARAHAELAARANTDDVTGLASRAAFFAALTATTGREDLSLIHLDLDDFKTVNDRLGHQVGDQVLRSLGGRLLNACAGAGLCARVSGNGFVVLLQGEPALAHEVALRAWSALTAPVATSAGPVDVGATCVYHSARGVDPAALVEVVNAAMKRAKVNRKGRPPERPCADRQSTRA